MKEFYNKNRAIICTLLLVVAAYFSFFVGDRQEKRNAARRADCKELAGTIIINETSGKYECAKVETIRQY